MPRRGTKVSTQRRRREKTGKAMEFGIFSQMHVPPDEDEHARFLREVEVSVACDAAGFKYDWAPEHHFLEHYSHQPAPEVFLSFVAARTRRIHVGHAIVNITSAVNHPARVAERIATLDHLTEGRVEFGTGRGSSSAEWGGFAIPNAAITKDMWLESIEQIPRMWQDGPYSFEGEFFRMPEREVLPKPFSKPNPPIWVACSSPPTFTMAGEMGLGALCFVNGTLDDIRPLIANYKAAIERCTRPVGGFVNDNIAVTSQMFCLADGDQARHHFSKAKTGKFLEYFFKWLDSVPRPAGLPATGPVKIPEATPAELLQRTRAGGYMIGSPEEIAASIRRYEEIGVDQLIYAPLTMTMDQKLVLDSIETFGKHVLPQFDRDPVHRTTRLREAALAARAA
jgi:alkanesulfonate monooxygenase SsuD/methylene tetrahydromethanopterin reductase-like flavin-dependent oxidoreductase (luciferase family)